MERKRTGSSVPPYVDQVVTADELIDEPGALQVEARQAFAKSASIVAIAFVVSRILGFAREIILAHQFGTTSDYDAYVSAFRVPDLLFLVIMSGAFGSAFIPIFAGYLVKGDRDRAWRLASAVITWTAVITIIVAIVAFAFADPLMRYLVAPDLPPEAHELSVRLMRILLLSPLLLGMGIAAKGILEAQDLFTLPALAPVLYNLAIVLSALFLAPVMGITGVAIGVVIGAALHVGVQVPGLIRCGMVFTPTLSRKVDGLAEVAALLGPRIIGQAAFQINFVAVNHFAAGLGEGRVSGLNYAWQMMMLPNGVLALSISTVVFPTMARQFDSGRIDAVRRTFMSAIEPLLFLILPASIMLYEFRVPIFQILFQSGSFDAESTQLAAQPLAFLAAGLVFYALVEMLARTFFAMHDSRTPVATGILIIIINIVGSWLLVDRFGHNALAMMLSISTAIEALILLAILRHRLGGLDRNFGIWFSRVIAAATVTALLAEAVTRHLQKVTGSQSAPRLVEVLLLLLALALVGGTYLVSAWLLKIPEVTTVTRKVTARLPI